MRDDLMREAFCFERQSIVTAEWAYKYSSFHYFCPADMCLVPVSPAKKTNAYFVAPGRHQTGCPNEPEMRTSNGPGDPKPKPTGEPRVIVPTILGPGQPPVRWNNPSREQLRRLIAEAVQRPIEIPGTLSDVVTAWAGMDRDARASTPLVVDGEALTYGSAFRFLKFSGDDVLALPWQSRIIFGAAEFWQGNARYVISTIKTFLFGDSKIPVRITLPPGGELDHLRLDEQKGTIFFKTGAPKIAQNQKSYALGVASDDPYSGACALSGILE